jgi:hypothetical protein
MVVVSSSTVTDERHRRNVGADGFWAHGTGPSEAAHRFAEPALGY